MKFKLWGFVAHLFPSCISNRNFLARSSKSSGRRLSIDESIAELPPSQIILVGTPVKRRSHATWTPDALTKVMQEKGYTHRGSDQKLHQLVYEDLPQPADFGSLFRGSTESISSVSSA